MCFIKSKVLKHYTEMAYLQHTNLTDHGFSVNLTHVVT